MASERITRKWPVKRRGFALVLALGLMALIVLLILAMAAFMQVGSNLAQANKTLDHAQQNALFALDAAIAQLQRAAGPDQRATATARLLDSASSHPHWTGVWETTANTPPIWLVSSPESVTPGDAIPEEEQIIVLNTSTADHPGEQVAVYKLPLTVDTVPGLPGSHTVGYYGWWISDESVKASLRPTDQTGEAVSDPARQQLIRQELLTETSLGMLWPEGEPIPDEFRRNTLTMDQVMYWPGADTATLRQQYFDYALESRGLLTNPTDGGLKYNLSALHSAPVGDPAINQAVVNFLNPSNSLTTELATAIAVTPPPADWDALPNGEPITSVVPILTELQLRMGVFHTRSDGLHRLRFHVEAEFWNPYARTMKFEDESASRVMQITFDGLPIIVITNEDSGSVIAANLSSFPAINAPNLRQVSSWLTVADTTLDSGEVYQILEPTASQPEGLARTLSATKWSWSDEKTPTTAANSICPASRISIRSQGGGSRITLLISRFDEKIPDDETPLEHAAQVGSVLELRNIPFDPIDLELDGDQYSREKSLRYTASDYRFAFHLRLKNDPATLTALRNAIDPRCPVLDFDQPAIRDLFEIESDPVAAVANANAFAKDDEELFQDTVINAHGANTHATIKLFDGPTTPSVSVGVLQHLMQKGQPAFSLTEHLPDRYFLTGDNTAGALPNSRLRRVTPIDSTPVDTTSTIAARSLEIAGAFNLNSASPTAWAAILSRNLPDWSNLEATYSLANPFFTLPFSAGESNTPLVRDSEIDLHSPGQRSALLTQGVRVLDREGELIDLAAALARTTQERATARGRPFESIEQWLKAGIVTDALEISGINDDFPPLSPTFLKPGDILTPLLPIATTRADTFTIRAYGEVINPVTGQNEGQAWCEATVQRGIEYCDPAEPPETATGDLTLLMNQTLGRRFHIVHFRWLTGPES